MVHAQSTQQAIINHPLLAQDAAAWGEVASSLHTRHYQTGEHVVHHGDHAEALWLVLDGWVKLTRQTPDGKETIIGLCTGGDIFGDAALFPFASYPYHVEAIGNGVTLAAVPAERVRAVIAANHHVSSRVMAMMKEQLSQAQLKLEHISTMSAAQRLGCFMLRLCHAQLGGSRDLHIPIEKNVLAAYLGMKPETLSRSQQQLKAVGIVVKGATVTVNDISKLREFVCGSCSESGSCDVEDAAN